MQPPGFFASAACSNAPESQGGKPVNLLAIRGTDRAKHQKHVSSVGPANKIHFSANAVVAVH